MNEIVRILKALADPNRLKILKILEQGPRCACEFQPLLGLAQPTVSKHLKVLGAAGLVEGRKVKFWVHYRLSPRTREVCVRNMLAGLQSWLDDSPEIIELRRRSELDSLVSPLA